MHEPACPRAEQRSPGRVTTHAYRRGQRRRHGYHVGMSTPHVGRPGRVGGRGISRGKQRCGNRAGEPGSQTAGGAREANRALHTTSNEYTRGCATILSRADAGGTGSVVTCVTLSACHSQAAQSGWLAATAWPTKAGAPTPRVDEDAPRPGSVAWVCATAPKVEKKTYRSATNSADMRFCRRLTDTESLSSGPVTGPLPRRADTYALPAIL